MSANFEGHGGTFIHIQWCKEQEIGSLTHPKIGVKRNIKNKPAVKVSNS